MDPSGLRFGLVPEVESSFLDQTGDSGALFRTDRSTQMLVFSAYISLHTFTTHLHTWTRGEPNVWGILVHWQCNTIYRKRSRIVLQKPPVVFFQFCLGGTIDLDFHQTQCEWCRPVVDRSDSHIWTGSWSLFVTADWTFFLTTHPVFVRPKKCGSCFRHFPFCQETIRVFVTVRFESK